jgi:DNA mismatch repair protein MSH5
MIHRFINADTLHSLQVLYNESHPNSHNQGPIKSSSGSKEGLSVYGLFHHLARTSQGRYLLRQYFLRPSINLDLINERLDAVQTFCRQENGSVLVSIVESLKAVGNMRLMMMKLKKGVCSGPGKSRSPSGSVWASIRRVSHPSSQIHLRALMLRVLVYLSRIENQGYITRNAWWRELSRPHQSVRTVRELSPGTGG